MFQDALNAIEQGCEAAFPRAEFAVRQDRLRGLMVRAGVDSLLVTGPENIFYLCGQQTPGYYFFQCLVVSATAEPVLVIRGLESFNARANSFVDAIIGYADGDDPAGLVATSLAGRGRAAIDRQGWFLSLAMHDRLAAACGPLLDGSGLVERLRRVKSPAELDRMRRSMATTDRGMQAGIAAVREGASENDIAAAVLAAGVRAGSEYFGMEPLICSGIRSGVPHATWRRRTVQAGELVVLENAGCIDRYHTALYRTVSLGPPPPDVARRYEACLDALQAGIDATQPGRRCGEVHAAVVAVLDRHGFLDGFRKRAGYSLGIAFAPDWGEGNVLSLNEGVETPIEPGMVFHIPVTLRDWGRYTVAVSDCVEVTADGNRPMSSCPRALVQTGV